MNKPRLSSRLEQIPRSAIHEMTRLSREIKDVAFLSWAKPTSGACDYIRRAASEAIHRGLVDGYSESPGLPELRREIAKKLARDNGIPAAADQILVTVGAIEGIQAAILTVTDPGDEVILPSPTFSTHIRQVLLASAKPVFVPTIEEEGFILDIEGIRRAVTPRTRAILFCTPSNPTGTVFSEQQLRQLAEIALEHNLMIITDEAYEYFTFDGHRHFSIGSMPEMRKNVVSCFSFTKTYAMTGWRIGYLHADEEWIPQINKAHISLAICVPVVSQYAAMAALTESQDCIDKFKKEYLASRDLMCQRLDRMSTVFSYQKPGGAYLMFPRILLEEGRDSKAFCQKLLREARVSATPGVDFGPTGERHLRLSFCVPEEMVNKAFDRMEEYFKIRA